MKSAIQELTDEVKKVKPMGVPLDLEYDYDYYIEMDKNNTCLFLDWNGNAHAMSEFKCDKRETALSLIDKHYTGNTQRQYIQFEYITKITNQ